MLRYLLAISFLACLASGAPAKSSAGCPNFNSNTWISLEGIDCYGAYVNMANLTYQDYCWSNFEFTLQTHVTLNNPSAQMQNYSVGEAYMGQKLCGMNETRIEHCTSHCMDKSVENALVEASMQLNTLNAFNKAQTAMQNLGKGDWPLLLIEPFVFNSKINFQYYDDMNFCVVDVVYETPQSFSDEVRSFIITHKTVPLK